VLERTQRLAGGIERVFAFFSDPTNLEVLTPEWLRFRVLRCSTDEVRAGTVLDYRLRLCGIPLRWRSLISAWEPPHRFVDEQLFGPYRTWVHEHRFEVDGGGVLVHDRVRYAMLGGRLVDRWLVRPDLERIFDHRRDRLAERFAPGGSEPAGRGSEWVANLEPRPARAALREGADG